MPPKPAPKAAAKGPAKPAAKPAAGKAPVAKKGSGTNVGGEEKLQCMYADNVISGA